MVALTGIIIPRKNSLFKKILLFYPQTIHQRSSESQRHRGPSRLVVLRDRVDSGTSRQTLSMAANKTSPWPLQVVQGDLREDTHCTQRHRIKDGFAEVRGQLDNTEHCRGQGARKNHLQQEPRRYHGETRIDHTSCQRSARERAKNKFQKNG